MFTTPHRRGGKGKRATTGRRSRPSQSGASAAGAVAPAAPGTEPKRRAFAQQDTSANLGRRTPGATATPSRRVVSSPHPMRMGARSQRSTAEPTLGPGGSGQLLQEQERHRITAGEQLPQSVVDLFRERMEYESAIRNQGAPDVSGPEDARITSQGWGMMATRGNFYVWDAAHGSRSSSSDKTDQETQLYKFPLAAEEETSLVAPVCNRIQLILQGSVVSKESGISTSTANRDALGGVLYASTTGELYMRWWERAGARMTKRKLPQMTVGDSVTFLSVPHAVDQDRVYLCGTRMGALYGVRLRLGSSSDSLENVDLSVFSLCKATRSPVAQGSSDSDAVNASAPEDSGGGLLGRVANSVTGVFGMRLFQGSGAGRVPSGGASGPVAVSSAPAAPDEGLLPQSVLNISVLPESAQDSVTLAPPRFLVLRPSGLEIWQLSSSGGHESKTARGEAISSISMESSAKSTGLRGNLSFVGCSWLQTRNGTQCVALVAQQSKSARGSLTRERDTDVVMGELDDEDEEKGESTFRYYVMSLALQMSHSGLPPFLEPSFALAIHSMQHEPSELLTSMCTIHAVNDFGCTYFIRTLDQLVLCKDSTSQGQPAASSKTAVVLPALYTLLALPRFPSHGSVLGIGAINGHLVALAVSEVLWVVTSRLHDVGAVQSDEEDEFVEESFDVSAIDVRDANSSMFGMQQAATSFDPVDMSAPSGAAVGSALPDQLLREAVESFIHGKQIATLKLTQQLMQHHTNAADDSKGLDALVCSLSQRIIDAKPFSGTAGPGRSRTPISTGLHLQRKQKQHAQLMQYLRDVTAPRVDSDSSQTLWQCISTDSNRILLEHGEKLQAAAALHAYLSSDDNHSQEYIQIRRQLLQHAMRRALAERKEESALQEGFSVADVFLSRVSLVGDVMRYASEGVQQLQHALGNISQSDSTQAERNLVLGTLVNGDVMEQCLSAAARYAQEKTTSGWLPVSAQGISQTSNSNGIRKRWVFDCHPFIRTHLSSVVHVLQSVSASPDVLDDRKQLLLRQSVLRLGEEFLLRDELDRHGELKFIQNSLKELSLSEEIAVLERQKNSDRELVFRTLVKLFENTGAPAVDAVAGHRRVAPLLEVAFSFAKRFSHFAGLVQLCDRLPEHMRTQRLEQYIGDDPDFAPVLFTVYDQSNKLHRLLLLAGDSKWHERLVAFLQRRDKPHISWHEFTKLDQFSRAAECLRKISERDTSVLSKRRSLSACKLALLAAGAPLQHVHWCTEELAFVEMHIKLNHKSLKKNQLVMSPEKLFKALLQHKHSTYSEESKQDQRDEDVWGTLRALPLTPHWNMADALRLLETRLRAGVKDDAHLSEVLTALWKAAIASDGEERWQRFGDLKRQGNNSWALGADSTAVGVIALLLRNHQFFNNPKGMQEYRDSLIAALAALGADPNKQNTVLTVYELCLQGSHEQ